MGNIASIPKKVYYVLARPEQNRFAPANGTGMSAWVRTPQESKQYASVAEAARNFHNVESKRVYGTGYYPLAIVRVEETAGTEQRVILGELQQEPAGSTVKYVLRYDRPGRTVRFADDDGSSLSWKDNIREATLFGTQGVALRALQNNSCLASGVESVTGSYANVLRVALIAGTPSLTETVLS